MKNKAVDGYEPNPTYSPFWTHKTENLQLPNDRRTLNAFYRSIYALHPIVNSIINTHSEVPLNYFRIESVDNKKTDNFYNDMMEAIVLMVRIHEMLLEYWLLGEAFVYAELDEKRGAWSRLIIQNPDYVIVKRSVTASEPTIMLRPDENLRRIIFSDREEDKKSVGLLNKTIVDHIKRGENIPLDNFYISHIIRKTSSYEVRGTGILQPILKALSTETPGLTTNEIRSCLMDPFSDDKLVVERVKFAYSSLFRTISSWLEKKIFTPIAKLNDLYEYKDGEKVLILPKPVFDIDALVKTLKE